MATVANGRLHVEVTKKDPCKICGAAKQCQVSEDGAVARCYRKADGAYESKSGADGRAYHLHRLREDYSYEGNGRSSEPRQPRDPKPDKGIPLAAPEVRHEVYTALLGKCWLHEPNRVNLRKRGLTDDQMERSQYKTLVQKTHAELAEKMEANFSRETLLSVPGFFVNDRGTLTIACMPGLLIPVRGSDGRIGGLKSRPDKKMSGGAKYFWVSSKTHGGPSPGAQIHVPLGSPEKADVWRITEGELKADVAWAKSGIPTLSAPGATIWRPILPILEAAGCRTVRLAFDADAWTNPDVAKALAACYAKLIADGYEVELERWPATFEEKDTKGIDDALVAGVPIEVLTGEAARAAVVEAAGSIPDGSADPTEQVVTSRTDEIRAKAHALLEADGADFATLLRDKSLLKDLAWLKAKDPGEFGALKSDLKGLKHFSSRDFDEALKHYKPEKPPRDNDAGAGKYSYMDTGVNILVRIMLDEGGFAVEFLSRFSARITEAITYDDGAEKRKFLKIAAKIQDVPGEHEAEIPADQYEGMGWVLSEFGPGAVILPGRNIKEYLRHGIQELSLPIPEKTIYEHTGWREDRGDWKYLHAGGAIGPEGTDLSVAVGLKGSLANFVLPDPPTGEARRRAIQASLGILRLGRPDRPMSRGVAAAMVAVPYRAAIRQANFSLQLNGTSGAFKSSVAALSQQHFGAALNCRLGLPASWSSTANRLEFLMHEAKDALLVIDDFVPGGSSRDVDDAHKTAERVFRAQGNNQGRQRLNSDGTPKPDRPPRGLVISTGEDKARSKSANARTLPLRFRKEDVAKGVVGTIDPEILSECQADADAGLYAASMAAFVQWLASDYEGACRRLEARSLELRPLATNPGDHGRLPDIMADLFAAFELFVDFALDSGAVTDVEAATYRDTVWDGLKEAAAEARDEHEEESDAGTLFVSLITAALASGHVYLADPKGKEVTEDLRAACGWRQVLKWQGNDIGQVPEWEPGPNASRIGWTDGTFVFLEPKLSYGIARRYSEQQGGSFPILPASLWKLLGDQKRLAMVDPRNKSEGKGRLTYRKQLEGQQHNVIVLRCSEFWPEDGESQTEDGPEETEVAF
jgi:hypothetical protein